jgi:hypothetical protein
MSQREVNRVNWKDGMKVNSSHFRETEHWILYELSRRSALNLNSFSYGLLPADNKFSASVSMISEQKVKVSLHYCTAITRGGGIIVLNEKTYPEPEHLFTTLDTKEKDYQQFVVLLSCNPEKRVEGGEPDPEEIPLRYPQAWLHVGLHVIPVHEVKMNDAGTFHLPVARFSLIDGKLEKEDYVPPCTCIASHPDLLFMQQEFVQLSNELRQSLIRLARQCYGKAGKLLLLKLAEDMTARLIEIQDELEKDVIHSSPRRLFLLIRKVIRQASLNLTLLPEEERLVLLNKINREGGKLENILNDLLGVPYRHGELLTGFNQLLMAYRACVNFFRELAYTNEEEIKQVVPASSGPKVYRGEF